MKTVDILAYPIFEVGTWNKMTFGDTDLDEIVRNFAELKHPVPLKLGHNDDQPLTDGQPALGWVENVRKRGKQILADFVGVPKIIKDLIRKKRYRAVSIELMMGLKRGEKAYKYVLDAVAILGAEPPAVHTLPDLNKYLAKRSLGDEGGQRVVFERQAAEIKFINQPVGGPAMDEDEKEIQKRIDSAVAAATTPLRAEIRTLEGQVTEYKAKFTAEEDKRIKAESETKNLKAKFEEIDTAAKNEKIRLARTSITETLDKAVKDRKITPAKRDQAMKVFRVDSDVEVLKIDVKEIKDFLDIKEEPANKARMSRDDESQSHGGGADDTDRVHKEADKEVDRLVKLVMTRDKVKYREAVVTVAQENPKLYHEYISTPPSMRAAGGN